MAYVRKHGNQLAIVHGSRDPDTGKVQQRTLFTLYSRPEAEAAIGRRQTEPPLSFRGLLEGHHENVRFDWPKIESAIAEQLHDLPERWSYRSTGVEQQLRKGIVELTRGLFAADPHRQESAVTAISNQRALLELLHDLIAKRFDFEEPSERHAFNRDNEFGWRAQFAAADQPTPEALEWLEGIERHQDVDDVEDVVELYLEIWPRWADGWNWLGQIAVDDDMDVDTALECFLRAVDLGRRLFPKRIAKDLWWTDLSTRPYIRGLRNLAQLLIRAGRSEEALAWCDRLERECHDADAAAVLRSHALLNTGDYGAALEQAVCVHELWPSQDFVAAFAAYELGRWEDALAHWLRANIVHPRAAAMITGHDLDEPARTYEEVSDHNVGVELRRALRSGYLKRDGARGFFRNLLASPEMRALVEEHRGTVLTWKGRGADERAGYERMMEMESTAFARSRAKDLTHLLES